MTVKPQDSSASRGLLAAIPNLRAFAISLSGNVDRADDLVQEALVRGLANLDRSSRARTCKAWLFTILRNAYFSELPQAPPRGRGHRRVSYAARLAVPPEQQGASRSRGSQQRPGASCPPTSARP